MAIKIPSYDAQQVQQRAAPTPNVVAQIPNMQEGLTQAMGTGLKVLNDAVEEANAARVKEFQLELDRWETQTLLGYKSRDGKSAVDPKLYDGKDPAKYLEDERKKFLESKLVDLTPGQRRRAEMIAATTGATFGGSILEHQIKSGRVYANSVDNVGVKQNSDALVIVDPANSGEIDKRMAGIAESVISVATKSGVDGSWAVKEAQSNAAFDAINTAAANGLVIDSRYDHLKSFLTEKQKGELTAKIAGKNEDNKAFALSQAFTGDILDPDARNKYAKESSGGDASLYKKITGLLDYDGASRKSKIDGVSSESAAKHTIELVKTTSDLNDLEKGIGADKTLTSDDRSKLLVRLQSMREHRIAQSDKAKSDAERLKMLVTARAANDLKFSPNIGQLSDGEFQAALDKLHPAHWDGLYTARAMAKASGGKTVVPKHLVKLVAEANGLKDDSQEALTASAMVSSRISDDAQGKGIYADKAPSDNDYIKMLNRYMKKRERSGFNKSLSEIQVKQNAGESIEGFKTDFIKEFGEARFKMIQAYLKGKGQSTDQLDMWFSADDALKDMQANTPQQYLKLQQLVLGAAQPQVVQTTTRTR